jgi:hypothetical protein
MAWLGQRSQWTEDNEEGFAWSDIYIRGNGEKAMTGEI